MPSTVRTAETQTAQRPAARYPAPKSAVGKFFWRQKMWVEATFALSMLERWEKIMVVTLFILAMAVFLAGVGFYLPHHIQFLTRRARYYLLGSERESFYAEWPAKPEL